MRVRSITYFCNPKYPLRERVLREAAAFLDRAKAALEAAGYEVQTQRIATIPFPKLLGEKQLAELPRVAREVDEMVRELGIGYASLGPALPDMPASYDLIPEAISATKSVFFGGVMADKRRGVDLEAVRRCARIIVRCAPIDPNGFGNLRFAALANVPAGSPFFPAAYHGEAGPAIALATEAADLAVGAFDRASTLDEGRRRLVKQIEAHAAKLTRVARRLARPGSGAAKGTRFLGIDFSLAPFPEEARSLGTAFERLGVREVGLHGSLMAAAIMTESIQRARFARAGFSGLFLPVLEDAVLSRRAAEGVLTVKDLLLYSAVCGTGLDTVPLPGDATEEQIAALLLDVAAMALRLDKPLTARLMPIPNKKAGEATGFDFDYFSNSKVMALQAESLHGPLNGGESLPLKPR